PSPAAGPDLRCVLHDQASGARNGAVDQPLHRRVARRPLVGFGQLSARRNIFPHAPHQGVNAVMPEPAATVFVVDDDDAIRQALASLIRSAGLKVETFSSAQEFLARPPADVPGCLVLDVRLPGLSGLDLQSRMAAMNLEIPIVFISGHGDVPTSVRAMKAGALEFLTKPFRDSDLLDAIANAIDRHRAIRRRQAEMDELNGLYRSLTRREREVMALVVTGMLNKQV